MNQSILDFVGKTLIDIGNKIIKRECELTTDILAPISIIDEIYDKISYKLDSGVTFSNSDLKESVVCINRASTREELINTISHEADHVQADICNYYDVPLDSEQAAYLIGYLIGKMYYNSRRLFCSY